MAICHSTKTYTQTPVDMLSVTMETPTKMMKTLFFKIFYIFLLFTGGLCLGVFRFILKKGRFLHKLVKLKVKDEQ